MRISDDRRPAPPRSSLHALLCAVFIVAMVNTLDAQQTGVSPLPTEPAIVRMLVESEGMPVSGAVVHSGPGAASTDSAGGATLRLSHGAQTIVTRRIGFVPDSARLILRAGADTAILIALRARVTTIAPVMVTSTRGERRLEPLSAQSRPLTPQDTAQAAAAPREAREPLFTRRDAYIAAGFAIGTVALFPVDRHVAERLQDSTRQANRFLHHAATGLELFASPGAFVIGGSLYAVGRLGHYPRIADLGLHGTEAIVVATAVTGALKGAAGRARPLAVNDTNPRDFRFGRGFTKQSYTSFPSGHTTTAFAAASAVTAETSRWWPRSTWYIGPVLYGGAAMVGLSRMYHNKHWASDVILGAGIGTFSGLKVVQYQHANPKNRLDRLLLSTTLAPNGGGGAMLSWSIPTR